MPAELIDPKSGRRLLHRGQAADQRVAGRHTTAAPISPPTAASRRSRTGRTCSRTPRSDGLSATQRMAARVQRRTRPTTSPRSTTPTRAATRRAATLGAFAFFTPQYDSLGRAEHHRPLAVRRAAALRAQALERRLPVRPELHARAREGSRVAARGRLDFAASATGGYTGFMINSWEPDQAVRQRRLRRPAPGERELDRRSAVRPGPALRQQHGRRARRHHRRLVHGRRVPLDAAASRSTSSTAVSAGRRTGTCRATRRWSTRACCRRRARRRT